MLHCATCSSIPVKVINKTVGTFEIFMNLYRKENHNYLENVDNYERNGELKRFKVIVKEISLCENIKGFLFRAMKKLLSGPVMFLPEDKTSSKWGERERENGGEERKVPQSS